ncbi:Endonuclease/exonuclease/phosphatase [Hygrophoropsis aurantiaca]|uniref:Endonuclease/exonuclease/phosphatase n=1 Tax=Hygrophoropsis aurantiaca TaxID=72124 RepID=A0ACB8AMV2_9AGAM|nr:Endonuclease/exonuclease/phosphatase [Hygrophoropsis aurantiaca]
MTDTQIKVVSLNCWGLKYVSKDRHERIAAIAASLARSDYDIIALQEIWVEADYEHIRQSVAARLPHAKLFHSGALGAGLAILTKWPIIATSITPYSLNGEPIDAFGGDWFVGKGAGSVTILHPILAQVQVFVTHLYAKGGEEGPEYNRTHRLVNAWEFAKLAKTAAELGRHVIAMGDFNSIPTSLPMTIIRDHAGLNDAWAASHPHTPPPAAMISPIEGIVNYGVTADSPLNSYRDSKPSGSRIVRQYQGKRLDYVLYRPPVMGLSNTNIPHLVCTHSEVVFTETIPGNSCSFSDHFGVEAILQIRSSSETSGNLDGDPHLINDSTPMESTTSLDGSGLEKTPANLTSNTISTMLLALTTSYRRSQNRSHKELVTFALSILLLLGLIGGSFWVPVSALNPIFVLLTVFISWLATTMLYEGFIFGNWELKALLNVIEELELYQKQLDGQTRTPSNYSRW